MSPSSLSSRKMGASSSRRSPKKKWMNISIHMVTTDVAQFEDGLNEIPEVAILVLLGSLASVPGCRSSNRVPYYTICIKNESGTDIPDVRVLFGTTHAVGGFLRPGQPVGVGVVPG